MTKSLAVFDIGTSSIKAGIINESGLVEALVHHPFKTNMQDLNYWQSEWWDEAFIAVCQKLIKKQKKNKNRSKQLCDGLVLSGNGPTLVALDAENKALNPALLWLGPGDKPLSGETSFFLPKVRWFRNEYPELMAKAQRFISCPEYLSWRLGADQYTICPEGEFRKAYWDADSLQAQAFEPGLFPPFIESGEVMGQVSAQASRWSGLPQGVPIMAGGSDFLMSLVGTGVTQEGYICDRAGSSEGLNYCSKEAFRVPGIRVLPHIVPGYYNNGVILGTTGLMFEWFRKLTGQDQRSYEAMLADIAALDADTAQDFPFFFPQSSIEFPRDFSKALFLRIQTKHSSIHLARAVVESIGFSLRSSIELLNTSGARIKTFRVCGGQARNREWNQIKADILNLPIEIPVIRDAELAGNAVMGFKGLGLFSSMEEGIKQIVKVETCVEPQASKVLHYSKRYEEYCSLENRLRCINDIAEDPGCTC